MTRILVRRESQVVHAKHHQSRRAARLLQSRDARQRKVRHPLVEPRAKVRPPQIFCGFFPVQRGEPALRLQHLARATVHFPAHIERQLRFDAHPPRRSCDLVGRAALALFLRRRATTGAVMRYSQMTPASSTHPPNEPVVRCRFAITNPPYCNLRRCRNCAEMLAPPYRVKRSSSFSVSHAPYFAAVSITSRSTSRCVCATLDRGPAHLAFRIAVPPSLPQSHCTGNSSGGASRESRSSCWSLSSSASSLQAVRSGSS